MTDDSNTDYEREITGASIFEDSNTITCRNASIKVVGSSTASFAKIDCSSTLEAITHQTSTTTIDNIDSQSEVSITCGIKGEIFGSSINLGNVRCKDMRIDMTSLGTINIKALFCTGTLHITINASSTLVIGSGKIGTVVGSVKDSSTGRCKANIGRNDVEVSASSTWDA